MSGMTNAADAIYLDLCRKILAEGTRKDDRTGTGTISYFGAQLRLNLAEGFPLLTSKKVPFRIIAEELLWFLSGSTDVGELIRKDVNIWNADAYRDYLSHYEDCSEQIGIAGYSLRKHTFDDFVNQAHKHGYDLGTIYGKQWRNWTIAYREGSYGDYYAEQIIDQIANVIESIRTNPNSRRHIVSAWNVGELDDMALPPCHTLFQFYVTPPASEGMRGKLSCQLYQRSADVFLGLPFNIASYALLTHIIAKLTDLDVGDFVHTLGDAHIYLNHIDAVQTQLQRELRNLPTLKIKRKVDDPAEYNVEDFELLGYNPHPTIKAPLSVGN